MKNFSSTFEKPKTLMKKIYQNARRTSSINKTKEKEDEIETNHSNKGGNKKGRYFSSKNKK